jgi:fructose-1,6-bisphosphatase/inositol monophosphatase family enzyme
MAAQKAPRYSLPMDASLYGELRAILDEAGIIALQWFRRVTPRAKADGTPVTEADRAVEEAIVERLLRAFPGESVLSEEGTQISGPAGAPAWYVDPIDGTGAFVSQLAYWGPTLCRVSGGKLQVGAFLVPRLGEYWYAETGGGAWRDGERLLRPESREAIGRNDVLFAPSRFHRRQPVPWPGKVRALGSSAAHLAHVAAGGGLVTVIPQWALWDVGCGVLLLREAGGVIWDCTGQAVEPEQVPQDLPLLAGEPRALRTLVEDGWARRVLDTRTWTPLR